MKKMNQPGALRAAARFALAGVPRDGKCQKSKNLGGYLCQRHITELGMLAELNVLSGLGFGDQPRRIFPWLLAQLACRLLMQELQPQTKYSGWPVVLLHLEHPIN